MKRITLLFSMLLLFGCEQIPDSPQTIILISFDGFRHDYIDRGITPNLSALADAGVRAKGLKPVFPSKTFSNHYSLVTGLLPSNNGIISNTIHDKETDTWFRISDADAVTSSIWWKGEPIWATAVKQGQRSACYFWVGSEAEVAGVRPTYWTAYDGSIPHADRVGQVLDWLDLPENERPSIITLYFSDTDGAGHRYGPESAEVNAAIAKVDTALGSLIDGLKSRDMFDAVNIMVVSDHGMSQLDSTRVLFWDDVQDPSTVTYVDQGPILTLDLPADSIPIVSERLASLGDHITVLNDDELRDRFGIERSPRVPDLYAIADDGWMILQRRRMRRPVSGGTHGYDNTVPSMQSTFVAHGPMFKSGYTVESVDALDMYALMAHILRLEPAPHDGSFERISSVLK
jgi:predicted AlkP superfamily pyrophosphatase or phosphodiesterase